MSESAPETPVAAVPNEEPAAPAGGAAKGKGEDKGKKKGRKAFDLKTPKVLLVITFQSPQNLLRQDCTGNCRL
jgi:hypothetical protein